MGRKVNVVSGITYIYLIFQARILFSFVTTVRPKFSPLNKAINFEDIDINGFKFGGSFMLFFDICYCRYN